MKKVDLSNIAQLILGAYALNDTHTLTVGQIVELARGALQETESRDAVNELVVAGYAESEPGPSGEYRLTRAGIGQTLLLQGALVQRSKNDLERNSD